MTRPVNSSTEIAIGRVSRDRLYNGSLAPEEGKGMKNNHMVEEVLENSDLYFKAEEEGWSTFC